MMYNVLQLMFFSKEVKIVVFASLITAMILPFSMTDFADAEKADKNHKDKTLERIKEKTDRDITSKKLKNIYFEEEDLRKKIDIETREDEKQKMNKRIGEIKSERKQIEIDNHKRDISKTELNRLITNQDHFEANLLNSNVLEFVTSIGIDITSKEIQIGLNSDIVNSENIDVIVGQLDQLMPKQVKWHVVYSDVAEPLGCTQKECDPVIGGNLIKVSGMNDCSFGFQAKKGSTWGWITAGHCADGKVGSSVFDYSGDNIGTVSAENFYWGTYCDCAWIISSSNVVDNKVYGGGVPTITKITYASQQQNDTIMKSGQKGGVDFGTVSAIHVTVIDFLSGFYLRDLVRSDVSMEHGDSGGTIVKSDDRGDLYGIATIHDWWGNYHTPIDNITTEMKVSPVLN